MVQISEGRGAQWKFATGIRVKHADDWNKNTQRLRSRAHLQSSQVNTLLERIQGAIQTAYLKAANDGTVRNKEFYYSIVKEASRSVKDVNRGQKEETLGAALTALITHLTTEKNEHTGELTRKGTLETYEVTLNLLKRLNMSKDDVALVDLGWYQHFVSKAERGGEDKAPLSKNYVGKHVKNIKRGLRFAETLGWDVHPAYKERGFRVLQEVATEIYLNEEEIQRIYNLDLSSQTTGMRRTRDAFIIGCYTGLRYSDFSRLSNSNIQEHEGIKFIRIRTTKTSKDVLLPIHPKVREIMDANGGRFPAVPADQTMNRYLKVIGQMAELDDLTEVERTEGGVKSVTEKHRFELIKTHTARRSFCTNAYLSGMDALDIMSISGHKTESSFLRYIRVTPLQRLTRLAEQKFFA